jgi:hypothetical protein
MIPFYFANGLDLHRSHAARVIVQLKDVNVGHLASSMQADRTLEFMSNFGCFVLQQHVAYRVPSPITCELDPVAQCMPWRLRLYVRDATNRRV